MRKETQMMLINLKIMQKIMSTSLLFYNIIKRKSTAGTSREVVSNAYRDEDFANGQIGREVRF